MKHIVCSVQTTAKSDVMASKGVAVCGDSSHQIAEAKERAKWRAINDLARTLAEDADIVFEETEEVRGVTEPLEAKLSAFIAVADLQGGMRLRGPLGSEIDVVHVEPSFPGRVNVYTDVLGVLTRYAWEVVALA